MIITTKKTTTILANLLRYLNKDTSTLEQRRRKKQDEANMLLNCLSVRKFSYVTPKCKICFSITIYLEDKKSCTLPNYFFS